MKAGHRTKDFLKKLLLLLDIYLRLFGQFLELVRLSMNESIWVLHTNCAVFK